MWALREVAIEILPKQPTGRRFDSCHWLLYVANVAQLVEQMAIKDSVIHSPLTLSNTYYPLLYFLSSLGRALALHARGNWFNPSRKYHFRGVGLLGVATSFAKRISVGFKFLTLHQNTGR